MSTERTCSRCGQVLIRHPDEIPSKFARRKTCGPKACPSKKAVSQPASPRKFQSRYGAGEIAPAQYLGEVMCVRIAENQKQELPMKFWDVPEWRPQFLMQVRFACKLLKSYCLEAILQLLEKNPRMFSLGGSWFLPALKELHDQRITSQTTWQEVKVVSDQQLIFVPVVPPGLGLLSKLHRAEKLESSGGQGQS
jgi:hypothetical protein